MADRTETAEQIPPPEEGNPAQSAYDNVYDNVFQTIVHYMPQLLIPLINYVFGTSYPKDVPFTQLKNELMTRDGKLITDSVYLIEGMIYHVECESSAKSVRIMLQRMIEYDFSIALRSMDEESRTIRLPASCVVYLRHNQNTPDVLDLSLQNAQGDTIAYRVQVVKAQTLSLDAIFERELILLLPYYLMRYENQAAQIEGSDEKREVFVREMEEIRQRLAAAEDPHEKYAIYQRIAELIIKVAEHVLRDQPKMREGVERVMGGHPYELIGQKILDEGRKQGMEQGRKQGMEQGVKQGMEQGRIGTYTDLVREGLFTVSEAARRVGLTAAEFVRQAHEMGLAL